NALLVPYYRCSAAFQVDQGLNDRVRKALDQMTRDELERNIKRYLRAEGFALDAAQPGLTDADRLVITLEMRRRSLDPADRKGLVEFAWQMWRNLDFMKSVGQIDSRASGK